MRRGSIALPLLRQCAAAPGSGLPSFCAMSGMLRPFHQLRYTTTAASGSQCSRLSKPSLKSSTDQLRTVRAFPVPALPRTYRPAPLLLPLPEDNVPALRDVADTSRTLASLLRAGIL